MGLTLREDHNFSLGSVEWKVCVGYLSEDDWGCLEGKLSHPGQRCTEGQG